MTGSLGPDGNASIREAQAQFFTANDMPADGGYSATWWSCEFGRLRLFLYNFRWRRKAIAHHDLHHILTGYECTMAGEIEMAAWEFAAGRYPHFGATLFCLPLVFCGVVFMPARTFAAHCRGRRSRSLYGRSLNADLLDRQVTEIRLACLADVPSEASPEDRLSFCAIVSTAALVTLAPLVIAAWTIGMIFL